MWYNKIQNTLLACIQTVEAASFISFGMNKVYIASQILNSEHKMHNAHVHAPKAWRFSRGKNLEINNTFKIILT